MKSLTSNSTEQFLVKVEVQDDGGVLAGVSLEERTDIAGDLGGGVLHGGERVCVTGDPPAVDQAQPQVQDHLIKER